LVTPHQITCNFRRYGSLAALPAAAFYEGAQQMLNLVDLRENKVIGSYDKLEGDPLVVCLVENKRCSSEEEWRALIKPFMED
jgi:hypothetical protein